jgi:glycosyltransferase involved in cell wall biosynthesis
MKNIVLVSNTSWYLYNFRLSIIHQLLDKGCKVYCIANYDDYTEKLIAQGVNYIQSRVGNKGTNPVSDLQYFRFLKSTYASIQPDFIFHYTIKPNIYGSLAAGSLNLRSIAVVSGAGYAFLREGLLNKLVRQLYTMAARKSLELWFVNKDDQLMFVDRKIVPENKTKVLPGEGINTEHFKREDAYPSVKDGFTFILSARMLWDKGVGVYVDAARKVKEKYPSAKFQLLGFIDDLNPSSIGREQIDSWVKEGVVEYLGVTDNVRTFLVKANCFVLPSYYREGVPRALLEAASLEMPIITTDNVGCREVVKDGYNGYLCLSRDVDSLQQKMEAVLSRSYDELKQMGANGRRKVIAEFHERLVLQYYENVLSHYSNGLSVDHNL